MAVRLKYALEPPLAEPPATLESLSAALDLAFDRARDGDTVFVMPTYTAMLELRKLLGKTLDAV
jgi:hypothetical protein